MGSGSRGNAIAVEAGGSALLVDAGFGPRSLGRRALQAGVDLERITAVVLTHEHRDHTRGARDAAEFARCPVLASAGTLRAMSGELEGVEVRALGIRAPFSVGPFMIRSCLTSHDAAEPLALTVRGPGDGECVGIAYDVGLVTSSLRRLLSDCSCVIVEANHDEAMLERGPYPAVVRRRISGPEGHLSNRAAARLLEQLCHPALTTVILAHLSHQCNTRHLACRVTGEALARKGFRGQLLAARQNEPLSASVLGCGPQLLLGPLA